MEHVSHDIDTIKVESDGGDDPDGEDEVDGNGEAEKDKNCEQADSFGWPGELHLCLSPLSLFDCFVRGGGGTGVLPRSFTNTFLSPASLSGPALAQCVMDRRNDDD